MAFPTHGHLPLLHGLQECPLRLRRCSIDLVGQDDVGEDGAGHEPEFATTGGLVLFDHLGAGHVRRHEVGRELDAGEFESERAGEGMHHQRLRQPRDAFDDRMATTEDRKQDLVQDLVLTDDHPGDLLANAVGVFTNRQGGFRGVFLMEC